MKLVYPKWFVVWAREVGDDEWEMVYQEGFDPKDRLAAEAAAFLLRRAGIGIEVVCGEDYVEARMRGTRGDVYGSLFWEFLMGSDLAKKPLAELLANFLVRSVMERGARDERPPG